VVGLDEEVDRRAANALVGGSRDLDLLQAFRPGTLAKNFGTAVRLPFAVEFFDPLVDLPDERLLAIADRRGRFAR